MKKAVETGKSWMSAKATQAATFFGEIWVSAEVNYDECLFQASQAVAFFREIWVPAKATQVATFLGKTWLPAKDYALKNEWWLQPVFFFMIGYYQSKNGALQIDLFMFLCRGTQAADVCESLFGSNQSGFFWSFLFSGYWWGTQTADAYMLGGLLSFGYQARAHLWLWALYRVRRKLEGGDISVVADLSGPLNKAAEKSKNVKDQPEARRADIPDLNGQLSKYHKGWECVICETNSVDRLLVPCGHLLCSSCIDRLWDSKCPYCRRQIMGQGAFIKAEPGGHAAFILLHIFAHFAPISSNP
ncbi:unnamed protein product [Chrysoparadoxa australica]